MEIQQVYSELLLRIENLSTLYSQTTTYVNQTISWFWTILLGVFTIIGVALYFLAQSLANKGIEKAVSGINTKLTNLQKQFDEQTLLLKECEHLKDGYRMIDGEREYFAPPMRPGVVYRTNERSLGELPIYTISLSCGYLPSQTQKRIHIPFPDIDVLFRSSIICTGNNKISSCSVQKTEQGFQIEICNDETYSSIDETPIAYVQIWYTKKQ